MTERSLKVMEGDRNSVVTSLEEREREKFAYVIEKFKLLGKARSRDTIRSSLSFAFYHICLFSGRFSLWDGKVNSLISRIVFYQLSNPSGK